MAQALAVFESPVFCLGNTIYPVDPEFDWTHDADVLMDAIRQTHVAMRMHTIAIRTPDRSWLACGCTDVARCRDLLVQGHALLLGSALTLEPDAAKTHARDMPVMSMFLRMVQGVALLATSLGLNQLAV